PHSAASDQRNPIAPSHRSHWSNSKRFFESDLLPRGRGIFRDAQKVKISDGLHPSRSVGMAGYNPQLAIGLANEWPEHSVASHAPKVTSNDVSTNHLYK
ncbi:MAG: hypothetical protein ACR2KT_16840, partial [Methylocella sp.]